MIVTPAQHPNTRHLNVPGSLWKLETPALVLDLDAMEANIALAARAARRNSLALRPHAKSHKSIRIAQLQTAAGAAGLCAQTIGEAEVLYANGAGVQNIHVASPLVNEGKIARVAALRKAGCNVSVVVDDAGNVAALAAAAQAAGLASNKLDVLVDIDMGRDKMGAQTPEAAVALARQIAAAPALSFAGLQGYAGFIQHIYSFAERQAAAATAQALVRRFVDALTAAGLPPPIITGGGTGSLLFDAPATLFTDVQIGSYVFMDVDYQRVAVEGEPDRAERFANALFVLTSVVSRAPSGRVTTDGGIKSFATDGPPPEIARGCAPGSTYKATGDEHGKVTLPAGAPIPDLGQRILCVVPHCDPNVNLFDWYHCVRKDTLVDIWPVDARGRSL